MKKVLSCLFYFLAAISFINIVLHILIQNSAYNYKKTALLPGILMVIVLICVIYSAIRKYERILEKHYKVILVVFLCVMAVLQIVAGRLLEYTPIYDMDAIYGGAITWMKEGSLLDYRQYFNYFPNNIGSMLFLHILFCTANFLGIHDYFMVATYINGLMSLLTIFVIADIGKREFGARYALLSLVFFAFSLPFYIVAPVFYTDALTLLFPVLFYDIYLLVKDSEKPRRQVIGYLLMGVVAGIGMKIKFTVFIMVVAVVIESLGNRKVRKSLLMVFVTGIAILLISVLSNAFVYSTVLEKEEVRKDQTPILHYIMMGLNGTGYYNPDDFEFSRSFSDPVERREAVKAEIARRIHERGFNGMFELLTLKGAYDFGDGTFGLSDYLDDGPVKQTFLHSYVLYDSEKYDLYRHICTSVFIAMLFFMIVSLLQEMTGGLNPFSGYTAPRIAVFGLMLFLCWWETRNRYCFNYVPVIFLSAIMGIDYFMEKVKRC